MGLSPAFVFIKYAESRARRGSPQKRFCPETGEDSVYELYLYIAAARFDVEGLIAL